MNDSRGTLGLFLGLAASVNCGDDGGGTSAGATAITTVSSGPSTASTSSGSGEPTTGAGSMGGTESSSGAATEVGTTGATASSSGATTDSPSSSSTGALKFDIGVDSDVPGDGTCERPGDPDCGCTAVDILFIVDNSGSMEKHKPAVAAAFDPFVDEMITALPAGTSLHVGVTRATGFYDPGNSSSWGNGCEFTPDGNWYPPEMGNNGVSGQQGRLFEQGAQRFYELEVGQDPGPLKTWFEAALTGAIAGFVPHSNTETVVAGAAYPFHPVNANYNAGFMREQAVLVLFLLSDAPDMSPKSVPTQDFIDIVSDAKAACGDMCILTTGAIAKGCYDNPGITNTRLYEFMNGFGQPPASFVEFGFLDTPDFKGVLGTALSTIIASTCEKIPPIPE